MVRAMSPAVLAPALARGTGFLVLWLVLIGLDPKDLPAGILAAAAASWASLALWPRSGAVSALGLVTFLLRFLPQSLLAGVDVARHAFAPRIGLRPGLVTYRGAMPRGDRLRAFCAVMSLQPGKLPVGTDGDRTVLVHCLDEREPVADQIAADEAAFLRVLEGGSSGG